MLSAPHPEHPRPAVAPGRCQDLEAEFSTITYSPSGARTVPSERLTAQNHLHEQQWASLPWSLCSQHTAGQEEASWPRAGDILQDVRGGVAQF